MEPKVYVLFLFIIGTTCSLELLFGEFQIREGKFFVTDYALSKGNYNSYMDCVLLCQRQKCCLSVLLRSEGVGYMCQFLDSFIGEEFLVDDVDGIVIFKADPSGKDLALTNLP